MLGIVLGLGDIGGHSFGAHEAYILGARETTEKESSEYSFPGGKKVVTKYKGKGGIKSNRGGKGGSSILSVSLRRGHLTENKRM